MSKYLVTVALLFTTITGFAQFGFVKKAEIERIKDTRMVVVLNADSSYNAAITAAIQKYWTFNSGYVFVSDTNLKAYLKKPEFSFLVFSKGKGSKIKVKVCSAENDLNGLLLAKSFKRKVAEDDMVAFGLCDNVIDTNDWWPNMVRGVQLLNAYMNIAIEGKDDRAISFSFLTSNYPTNKGVMSSQTLIFEKKQLELKPSEDAAQLWDGDVDEQIDRDVIYQAIISQDPTKVYYYQVIDEKYCNKLVISAANSELMYYDSGSRDNCKLKAKDLKELKAIKIKAAKM